MELTYIDPKKIKIREGMDRIRMDGGDLKRLAESIVKFGQLHPVIITKDFELVSGGRRTAACMLAGKDVLVAYKEELTDLELRELELEENVQRKNLTPAEECIAIKQIHELKQAIHGTAKPGPQQGNDKAWTLDDTAALINRTRGSVIGDIDLATIVEQFPELSKCKTKREIRKAAEVIEKTVKAATAGEGASHISKKDIEYIKGDAIALLKEEPDNTYDLLLTDPPYGIDIGSLTTGLGGRTGALTTSGVSYNDEVTQSMEHYRILAEESFRITKNDAHAYIFSAPEYFYVVRDMFLNAGWLCYIKPLIWVKGTTGQTNMPKHWPASTYEMILFCRKENSSIISQGRPDAIQIPAILPNKKLHSAEKPVDLMKELILRVAYPGSSMIDPFAGSASSLEAAYQLRMKAKGFEILPEAFGNGMKRIKGLK